MTPEEIHNIWLHMSGKAEGLLEAGGEADLPVMFANAILEYTRKPWVGLTPEEAKEISLANRPYVIDMVRALEQRLKEKNT